MTRIKILNYVGYTNIFDKPGLYKYNLVMINNQRFIKEFSNWNNHYIISNGKLQTNIKLLDAIKYYDVCWCSSISEILR